MPPVQPMLAKSVRGSPPAIGRRRAALRAEVGRLPLHRVPGRRRDRARQPRHQAPDALLPRGRRRRPRAAARAVRPRRRADRRVGDRLEFERSRSASTRPSRGSRSSPRRRRRRSSRSTCSRSTTSRCPDPARRATCAARARRSRIAPAVHLTPRRRSGEAAQLVRAVRGRGPRRRRREAASATTRRTRARCSRSSTSGPPTSWSAGTACTRRRPRSAAARLAAARALRRRQPPAHRGLGVVHRRPSRRAARRAAAAGLRGPADHPWGQWSEMATASGDRMPGHAEPVERGQGPVVRAAAARAGARGRLRPHGGRPVPAHRAVQAVAEDRDPETCTYEQLEEPVSYDLADVLGH